MSKVLFEWKLALRYLAGARGQGTFSLLTVLAILGNVVGVTALIVGQAVMAGIETRATQELVANDAHIWLYPGETKVEDREDETASLGLSDADLALLGVNIALTTVEPARRSLPFDDSLLRDLHELEGVESLRPVIELDVFVNFKGQFDLQQLRGISLSDLKATGAQVRPIPTPDEWGLIIPEELTWRYGLEVGQSLNLITTKLEATPFGRLPVSQEFEILGTYRARAGSPLLTTLATTQFLLELEGQVNSIEVYVDDAFNLNPQRTALSQATEDRFELESWDERSDSAAAFIGVLRVVLLVVLGLIILVSAFNIFAGQLMLTDAQRNAIAVMRSFGATRATIMRIFLFAGLIIGVAGACFGLVLGIVLALNFDTLTDWGVPGLEFFAQSPPILRMGDMIFAFCIALVLALIAAILPARSAAGTPPVEAFRYG